MPESETETAQRIDDDHDEKRTPWSLVDDLLLCVILAGVIVCVVFMVLLFLEGR